MSNASRGQYREVADRIRAGIRSGEYPRGRVLPTEDQLADALKVHRATVNRALKLLGAEGLVRVHRGKGTFVTELPPITRNAVARYSRAAREHAGGRGAFDIEIKALGRTPRSDQRVERVTPPAFVAELLEVSNTEPSTIVRARRMYADDIPIQIADSYIPFEIAEGTQLAEADSGPGGIISRFADLGYRQARITERLTVRPPAPEEAAFLKMTEDQRVYEVVHTGWTAEGRAVEVCVHIMPTHLWILDYEWPTDDT